MSMPSRAIIKNGWGLVLAMTLTGMGGSLEAGNPAQQPASVSPRIHGVKLYLNQDELQAKYPDDGKLLEELKQSGVNAVFTTFYEGRTAFYPSRILPQRDATIDLARFRAEAKRNHIAVGAICHIFYDADTVERRKDLIPVDQHGDSRFVNWQKFVCPSDKAYQAYKLSIVKEIARTLRPDILSLNFMRFPTTWEIIPADAKPDDLRNFCFCDRCLAQFQKAAGLRIPKQLTTTAQKAEWILKGHAEAWERWKTGTITGFVATASRAVRAIDPSIKVSVHVVPWTEATFERGLTRIAGQDVKALGAHVDYLSPMLYHKLIGHPPEYIHTLTAELQRNSGRGIMPSLQFAQVETEGQVSPAEFKEALGHALQEPSTGVLLYHWAELRPDATFPAIQREKRAIFQAAAPK
ncbi:putative glycoside hydrolase [Geothrix sp. PMB-07]|uniref:putative glycoside hydrolase n=1 Tax=Geothrix sp. PMB-07 TaxID=3068640 RepID=UPI0027421517|nr:putative glycoside hydrolase [Geothrix sp. PMB-07]WLT30772.1 putative glycoside hydrolase [Geothrix sp. PMB-07]